MTFRDLEPIETACKSVAPYILENAGYGVSHTKTDGTPVTVIDIETERRIKSSIGEDYPDIKILGEETGYDPDKLPNKCWIIDPIDGTKSYIKNIPTYTTMAVYIENNEALACVVYNPSTDEMFKAIKNKGAYLNNHKLTLKNTELPTKAVAKSAFAHKINDLGLPITVDVPPAGAGYPFSQIAKGTLAARFNYNAHGHIHDYITGILLVTEAGGSVIPINDTDITIHSRSFIACHPKLTPEIEAHKEALAAIEKTTY